jgi:hypothetical protein
MTKDATDALCQSLAIHISTVKERTSVAAMYVKELKR